VVIVVVVVVVVVALVLVKFFIFISIINIIKSHYCIPDPVSPEISNKFR
jgi:hypothetical protein